MLLADGRQSGSMKFAISPDIIGAREQMFGNLGVHAFSPQTLKPQALFGRGIGQHHAFSSQTLKPQGLFGWGNPCGPGGVGDLGTGDATTTGALIALVASIGAFAGGIVLDLHSYKKAPMPASMRPIFKTGIQWMEPDPVLFGIATVLKVGGVIGALTSIRFLLLR